MALNAAGQLEVTTPVGGFTDGLPVAWQDGPGGRTPVAAAYDLEPTAHDVETATGFGFRLGAYDPTRTLVLDPIVLLFSGYIGGSENDEGKAIAVDVQGNTYVTGYANSDQTTFPVVVGPDLSLNGSADAFVVKVDPTGTTLLYAGYIGGADGDIGYGIAVDEDGNAYVAGATRSEASTFPVLVGPDLTSNGLGDAFVAKVNAAGTTLLYAGYIGGAGSDFSDRHCSGRIGPGLHSRHN